jgi:hypothetical protein
MRISETDLSRPRMRAAIAELQDLIRAHYPNATFELAIGDDPDGVYLIATVDRDDPEEVMDVVVDRLLQLQNDEGVPLFVVPLRTPERRAAMLAERDTVRRRLDIIEVLQR